MLFHHTYIKNEAPVYGSPGGSITPEMRSVLSARDIAKMNDEIILEKPDCIKLFTINGVGTAFYGDDEFLTITDSYIIEHWFALFFLPLIPLGKYRVMKIEEKKHLLISKIPFKDRPMDTWSMFRNRPFSLVIWCIILASCFAFS